MTEHEIRAQQKRYETVGHVTRAALVLAACFNAAIIIWAVAGAESVRTSALWYSNGALFSYGVVVLAYVLISSRKLPPERRRDLWRQRLGVLRPEE